MDVAINETFDISKYGGKLFDVKPAVLAFNMNVGADPASEGGKMLQQLVEKGFRTEFTKFIADKQKEYQDALRSTEVAIIKRAQSLKSKIGDIKKWLAEELKGAQVMISNAIKTFEGLIRTKAEEFYAKAAAAIDKKFKTDLRNMKIKAALSIVKDVVIIIAAAALAIVAAAAGVVATGATMGVGAVTFAVVAPVVAGALGTIAKSGYSIYQTVDKTWPTHKKALANLVKVTGDLQSALEYEARKADKSKLGPKEKIKLLLGNVKGKRDTVAKAIKEAEVWHISLAKDLEKFSVELKNLQEQASKGNDKGAPNDIQQTSQALSGEAGKLSDKIKSANFYFDKFKAAMKEADTVVNTDSKLDPKALGTVLGKFQDLANDNTVQTVISEAPGVLKSVASLVGSINKIAKAA